MNISTKPIHVGEKPNQILPVRQIRLPFFDFPDGLALDVMLFRRRRRRFTPLHFLRLFLLWVYLRLFVFLDGGFRRRRMVQEEKRVLSVTVAPVHKISEPPQLREPRRVALLTRNRRRVLHCSALPVAVRTVRFRRRGRRITSFDE
ncbi:hypothetical protein SLA2020_109270 [Shorea laevis]